MSSAEKPIRVLVAEDVAVNRELIRLFLLPRGYAVDAVNDGAAAVEAVLDTDYDLVLMDMQMPGMDGLEATREIRRHGGKYGRLPIIALSANIIPQQVQRCLDAGMTAHLCKPFTAESLTATIERWARMQDAPTNPVLNAFVQQAGWESVRSLLDMMLAQIDAFEACPADDFNGLSQNAHALRGAASALGYGDLAKVCRELEEACRAGAVPPAAVSLTFKATAITRREIAGELSRAA